jgi:hypothetical protein
MKKAWIVREKGYEYNDNWYDLEENHDKYTELFLTEEDAIAFSKTKTANFIGGESVNKYFNDQSYRQQIVDILDGEHEFHRMSIENPIFVDIYELIKDDTFQVLEIEIEDGDPYIASLSDGTKMYYKDGKLHRANGPAVIKADGREEWYLNGELHRIDGPARVDTYGDEELFVSGRNYWQIEKYQEAARNWIQENRNEQIDNVVNE